MAGIKWWGRVILDTELDRFGGCFTRNLCHDRQAKVDTRRHSAGGNGAAIFDNATRFVGRAHEWEQIGVGPMSRGPAAPEQSRSTQHKSTCANRRHIFCLTGLSPHE